MFLLFFYNQGQEDLLKAELKKKAPLLKLSFSSKSIMSMKLDLPLLEKEIQDLGIIYTQRIGLFIQKESDPSVSLGSNERLVSISENEFWRYKIIPRMTDQLDLSPIELPVESPSRSFLKMAEAKRLFDIPLCPNESVLEIGAAPGGITYYLLQNGLNVVSVDPANMDEKLKSEFPENFTHLKESIFDVEKSKLPKNVDWIVMDLNLPGDLSLSQAVHFHHFYPNVKGVILTVKTPKPRDVLKISRWILDLSEKKYDVFPFQLSSHRREIGLLLRKW